VLQHRFAVYAFLTACYALWVRLGDGSRANLLKIDRTFIMGIPQDKDDVAITSSIIDIARNLNIKTVAEGVETEAHCEFLRKAGCNIAQGYYFDKPLPADVFSQRL